MGMLPSNDKRFGLRARTFLIPVLVAAVLAGGHIAVVPPLVLCQYVLPWDEHGRFENTLLRCGLRGLPDR